jgi:hypothetical protein
MSTMPETFDATEIRSHRYGVIEIVDGQLGGLHFRRWPKLVSLLDVMWLGPRYHARTPGNRCLVYYNQPRRFPSFLALSYLLSTRECTLASVQRGLVVLDEVARLKQSDALLCDAWNSRISERILARYGWKRHTNSRWHCNYIKRFYGVYPTKAITCEAASIAATDLVAVSPDR